MLETASTDKDKKLLDVGMPKLNEDIRNDSYRLNACWNYILEKECKYFRKYK